MTHQQNEIHREGGEAERQKQLIEALTRLAAALEKVTERLERPPPGWQRLVEDFRAACRNIPPSIRMRF